MKTLTAAEAASLLHMHVKHVQLLAREGRLPAVRQGRRWLFDRDELLKRRARPSRQGGREEREAPIDLSARNQLVGRVKRIAMDGLMAEVSIAIRPQTLVALITRQSAERLGLDVGVEALAIVKSTEVMVARRSGS